MRLQQLGRPVFVNRWVDDELLRAAQARGAELPLTDDQRDQLDGATPLVFDGDDQVYVSCQGMTLPPRANAGWPILSNSMAVHPVQIDSMRQKARQRGVPTEFTPDGRPVLQDRGHARRFRKAFDFYSLDDHTD